MIDMAGMRCWLWLGGLALATSCSTAAAQTFYKWTDDQGIVHFADMPPPKGQHVEERQLPAPPPAEAPAAAQAARVMGAEAPPPVPAEGPARVILLSRQAPRTGPSSMHIFGEVKNVGGKDAQRVAVTVSSVDSTAGTPCMSEETAVAPSTLRPGESGKFDVDLDNPCLLGEPQVDVAPLWD
jgi:hypothetical protein